MDRKNKKIILITGGFGFIGSNLLLKIIDKKYDIVIIDNFSNANKKIYEKYKSRLTVIKSDICDKGLFKKLKNKKIDTVIHLAAKHYIPDCVANKGSTIKINIGGTNNILELCKRTSAKKFVFASSGAVYAPKNLKHKESDPVEPIDIYGKTKLIGERQVMTYCHKNNISYAILRLFNVYGKYDNTPHFIPAIVSRIKKEEILQVGNLNTFRDYVHIDDVVRLIFNVLERPAENDVFNVGSGKRHSGKQVINLIGKMKGKKIAIKKVSILTRKNDRKFLYSKITKAKKEYSWSPKIDLMTGLKDLLN